MQKALNVIFSAGSALFAGAIIIAAVGFVVGGQGSFATTYVTDQLTAQGIAFPVADKLTDAEKSWKPGSTCLATYAGQKVLSGKQAECYANYFIDEHMAASAKNLGYAGATYASYGSISSGLKAEQKAAQEAKDSAKATELQKKIDAVTAARESAFKGEMLRSALLTVYGFSVVGDVATLAGTAAYAGAGALAVLGVIVFIRRGKTA